MSKAFKRISDEIKHGENLDIYLTILLAVVVALLGILQIASFEIISAVTLATLGLLASSLLASRRTITETKEASDKLISMIRELQSHLQGRRHISDLLTQGYPDLTGQLKTAKRVSISGSTLSSTAHRYTTDFINLLQRGGVLRVLVSEPSPEVLAMQVFRSSGIKDTTVMTNTILRFPRFSGQGVNRLKLAFQN